MKLRWLNRHLRAVLRLYIGRLLSIFCAFAITSAMPFIQAHANGLCSFALTGAASRLPEIQTLSQALFKKYPMGEYEYVFVGRSLTMFYAYLKVQALMYPKLKAWVLPISLKDERSISDAEYLKRFEDVFYRFRGARDLGSRKIVFIDYVDTGRTMIALDWILRRAGIESELAGVTDNPFMVREILGVTEPSSMRALELFPISLQMQLDIGSDRWYAPYPQGRIQDADFDPASLQPENVEPRFTEVLNAFKLELFGSL